MCKNFLVLLISLCCLHSMLYGEQSMDEMLHALEMAAEIDKKLHECFPVTFNYLLSTGYFITHAARMTGDGSIGIGIAHVPPYLNWNARIQPFSHLEFSANYRVFRGCEDPVLGPYGFGDYADRGANFKFALFTPEESLYFFPGLAVGIDDFMGSKKFTTYYLVATQVMRDWGIEASFGWGAGRYSHGPSRGFFGGVNWFPYWSSCYKWIRGLAGAVEYDPTNYAKDPHPNGRVSHFPINFGAKYSFNELIELSASYMRGQAFAASGSLHYNWGKTCGFLPKIEDPPSYLAPIDTEPLGCFRTSSLMIQEMNYALDCQGFQLTKAWIERGDCNTQRLCLMVINNCYRQEHVTRMRLQNLLASLTPENINEVVVVIESFGLPCHQYVYNRELLIRYATQSIGCYEFDLLTPRLDFFPATQQKSKQWIFQKRLEFWRAMISPRFETFFGNARGKFKYDFGVRGSLDGFLPHNWYYEFQISYTLLSTLQDISDFDIMHPSQLPNVATDYVRYRQQSAFSLDICYLQKTCNFGSGYFGRISGGYFQVNYAGLAAEFLWYPAHSCLAIGLEGAVVKKRRYAGLGFQSSLRQFEDRVAVVHHYTTLQQFFLDLYLDFPAFCFFSKLSIGQFLARDIGARLELTRYFDNGLRLTGWLTFTNASDMMHGEKYYDRGIALEIPFDLFYKRSSRRVWNYAMAAWLRDAGYTTTTGKPLFDIVNRERRF